MNAVWYSCFLLPLVSITISVSAWASDTPAEDSDRPPFFFTVYSPSGNESFKAECSSKRTSLVTCKFSGLRFHAPKTLAEGWKAEWDALSPQERKAEEESLSSSDTLALVKSLKEKLKDSSIGPKTKLWLQHMISAFESKSPRNVIEASLSKDARTCSTFTQTFSLDFQKIGKGKWLSNPGPGGLCQIVKLYELQGDGLLWTMTETRVTAGETEGPICEGVTDEIGKPTVWTWKNPNEWELPCDFISHTVK